MGPGGWNRAWLGRAKGLGTARQESVTVYFTIPEARTLNVSIRKKGLTREDQLWCELPLHSEHLSINVP